MACVALALLMAACSSDDGNAPEEACPYVLVGATDRGLDWTPIVTSRGGTDIDAVIPETIGVWAYTPGGTVFDNQEMFYLNGSALAAQSWWSGSWYTGNLWPYSPVQPWEPLTAYRFLAYAPYTSDITLSEPSYDGMQMLTWRHVPRTGSNDFLVSSGIVDYTSRAQGVKNDAQTVYLKHILSRLRFCFKLSTRYTELRYIHLKEMTVENADGMQFTVTVDYSGGVPTVRWDLEDTASAVTAMPLTKEPGVGEYLLLPDTSGDYVPFASCYVYPHEDLSTVTITVTYDVYDMEGQLLRYNDTATNSIWLGMTAFGAGLERTLEEGYYYDVLISVQPSFLYVLSDNDPGADGYIVIK